MAIPPSLRLWAREHFAKTIAAENDRRRRFGHVRPIIHTDFQGRKLVAVGSTIFSDDRWKTFPDFLCTYLFHVFGSGWWQREFVKPIEEKHTVAKWFDHHQEMVKNAQPDERGVCPVVPDGLIVAFLLLAYDLYVLRDHGKLQKQVLERLRRPDHFFGARYELLIAATFIRAGFDIDYEDESDPSRKHPEFIATHRDSKFQLAVEAKARHRTTLEKAQMNAGVKNLISNAATKKTDKPYAIFVEVNLPPEERNKPPSWMAEVDNTVKEVVKESSSLPFDLVFFTNIPHQYGAPSEPDPTKHYCDWIPTRTRIPPSVHELIVNAVLQYGAVPAEFPAAAS